jgi:hypothetical protein
MADQNKLTLSHATYLGPSGATAAATYQFMTKGYKPPAETRHIDSDIVHNQNGRFKYVYDNGGGFRRWNTFQVSCQQAFQAILGANAQQQYDRLREMWVHKGVLGMTILGDTYSVHWAQDPMEPAFVPQFPVEVGGIVERDISVQFEEA